MAKRKSGIDYTCLARDLREAADAARVTPQSRHIPGTSKLVRLALRLARGVRRAKVFAIGETAGLLIDRINGGPSERSFRVPAPFDLKPAEGYTNHAREEAMFQVLKTRGWDVFMRGFTPDGREIK